jgi:hypothetical protein
MWAISDSIAERGTVRTSCEEADGARRYEILFHKDRKERLREAV